MKGLSCNNWKAMKVLSNKVQRTLLGLGIIITFLRINVPSVVYNTLSNSCRIILVVFISKLFLFIADPML